MSERKQKPREATTGEFTLPDERAIEAARNRRETHKLAVNSTKGTVVGLDYNDWAAALIDLGLPPSRQEHYRVRWAALGWTRLDGRPTVIGYDRGAEVWIKPRADATAALDERRQKIERLVGLGYMHTSALGGNVHVQRQLGPRIGAL